MEKYSEADISAIYAAVGYPDETPQRSSAGFRNQVWLGERAVLKRYGEENRDGFRTEKWFYETAHPTYAPKLLAVGEDWILLERIHGTGLFQCWRDWTDAQREAAVAQIAGIALSINEIDWSGAVAFLPYRAQYGKALVEDIDRAAADLIDSNAIPESLARQVQEYAHRYAHLLDGAALHLVYNDLHFDNLLVEESGRIVRLDFEMLAIAPKDLVLDVWQRMLIHPFTYANEEDHALTLPKDYTHLLTWMQKSAPSLFAYPEIRRRVNLYAIWYELDLLREFPRANWPIERLQTYLSETLW